MPTKARALIASDMPTLQSLDSAVAERRLPCSIPEAELTAHGDEAIEQNISTLRNRINELGVAEPIIQRQGSDRIVVQLPGVQDTAQAKSILGATATLEYRARASRATPYDARRQRQRAAGRAPVLPRELGPDGKPMPVLLNKRVIVSGDQLVGAHAGVRPQTGTPAVSVTLNGVGGQRMFDFTSDNVGKPMAVVYIERIPEVQHGRRQGSAHAPGSTKK